MTKFKRFMALAAVSMLGIQLMGVGTAFAAGEGDCDFGNNDLEITLGDEKDVDLWIDDERLFCDANTTGGQFNTPGSPTAGDDFLPLSAVESITVEMDHDDSVGKLYIGLEDTDGTGGAAADWPDFDTFDIDVTTEVHLDGTGVDDASANRLRITVGAKSLSFSGTTATSNAPKYDIEGGAGGDTIDASKATARITADGNDGSDVIKGGSGKDDLSGGGTYTGESETTFYVDVIYGNGGNDTIECSADGSDTRLTQGWGGEGDDSITNCNIVAPGAGNDDVFNTGTWDGEADAAGDLATLSYADLTKGVEWDSSELATGGAAGEDLLDEAPLSFTGSQGDDVIYDETSAKVSGAGGDDLIKVAGVFGDDDDLGTKVYGGAGNDVISDVSGEAVANKIYGEAGNDVLRGKMGDDSLFGGGGQDQTWGGPGADTCGGEVTNRCEYFTKK